MAVCEALFELLARSLSFAALAVISAIASSHDGLCLTLFLFLGVIYSIMSFELDVGGLIYRLVQASVDTRAERAQDSESADDLDTVKDCSCSLASRLVSEIRD